MLTTGDAAPAGTFEIRKSTEKTSCVALFENVREMEMQEGRKGWQWDEYTMPVTYREELEDCIRNDTASWLSAAKEYEKKTLAVYSNVPASNAVIFAFSVAVPGIQLHSRISDHG